MKITSEIGKKLQEYRALAQSQLFRNISQCSSFIWAMNRDGDVYLAVEELVVDLNAALDPSALKSGYPRRRGFPCHPAEEKKLGHPTLVANGDARVAGELYLDAVDGNLHWFVNCSSGRYCREVRPTDAQCDAVHELFISLINDQVLFDDPHK